MVIDNHEKGHNGNACEGGNHAAAHRISTQAGAHCARELFAHGNDHGPGVQRNGEVVGLFRLETARNLAASAGNPVLNRGRGNDHPVQHNGHGFADLGKFSGGRGIEGEQYLPVRWIALVLQRIGGGQAFAPGYGGLV